MVGLAGLRRQPSPLGVRRSLSRAAGRKWRPRQDFHPDLIGSKPTALLLSYEGIFKMGDRSVTLRLRQLHNLRHYFYATATAGCGGTVRTFIVQFQRLVTY